MTALRRERYQPCATERLREPRQHREISVEPYPFEAAYPQERKAVLVLEASELAFSRRARRPSDCTLVAGPRQGTGRLGTDWASSRAAKAKIPAQKPYADERT